MNYNTNGFRALYKKFAVFKLNETLKDLLKEDPHINEADCALTYGYIDHECGFSLEVLACGSSNNNDNPKFFPANNEMRSIIRIDTLADENFIVLEKAHAPLMKHYAEKLQALECFNNNPDLELLRGNEKIDKLRHPIFVDDLVVNFVKDNTITEKSWVRAEGFYKDFIIGTLLDQPTTDLPFNSGDLIHFFLDVDEEDNLILICDANDISSDDIVAEDFEEVFEEEADDDVYAPDEILDLNTALINLKNNDCKENYLNVLIALTRAELFIPCVGYMRKGSAEEIAELENYVGSEIVQTDSSTNEIVYFDPDVVKFNDDENPGQVVALLPIFSSEEEYQAYNENLYLIPQNIFEIISLLQHSSEDVENVILNPFSDEVVFPVELLYQLVDEE